MPFLVVTDIELPAQQPPLPLATVSVPLRVVPGAAQLDSLLRCTNTITMVSPADGPATATVVQDAVEVAMSVQGVAEERVVVAAAGVLPVVSISLMTFLLLTIETKTLTCSILMSLSISLGLPTGGGGCGGGCGGG